MIAVVAVRGTRVLYHDLFNLCNACMYVVCKHLDELFAG